MLFIFCALAAFNREIIYQKYSWQCISWSACTNARINRNVFGRFACGAIKLVRSLDKSRTNIDKVFHARSLKCKIKLWALWFRYNSFLMPRIWMEFNSRLDSQSLSRIYFFSFDNLWRIPYHYSRKRVWDFVLKYQLALMNSFRIFLTL